MSLSVYEKNNVEAGKDCVVLGKLTFNVLDKPRTPAPSDYVPNPKPEYVVSIENPEYVKGDANLIKALKATQYGKEHNQLSIRDKSPFAPTIFGVDNEKSTTDKAITEGTCLSNGQEILIHVTTYEGHGNVGSGFDAIKVHTPLKELNLQNVGGVSADVFDF